MEIGEFLDLVGLGSHKLRSGPEVLSLTERATPGLLISREGTPWAMEQDLSVCDAQEKSYQSLWRTMGINEKFVQCLWVDQIFRKGLIKTVEGPKVEILSPGRWNLEGGPDFHLGKLRFLSGKGKKSSRKIRVGDIEVHLLASSWKAHGHNKDKAYDNVILHVFLWRDNPGEPALSSQGLEVSQVELLPILPLPLSDLKERIKQYEYPFKNPGSRGGCHELVNSLSTEKLGALLDDFGDLRFLEKSIKFCNLFPKIERQDNRYSSEQAREQLVYQQMMEAMGIKNNRVQFYRLAALFDINRVRELLVSTTMRNRRVRLLETALMTHAGFLPIWNTRTNLDRDSRLYLARLQRDLPIFVRNGTREVPSNTSRPDMVSSGELLGQSWQYRGMRPANYPARRIAGISNFLVNCMPTGIFASFQKILEDDEASPSSILAALTKLFKERSPSYWHYRYVFNGKKLPGRVSLIGKDRIIITLINVLFPLLFAWAWLNWDIDGGRKIYRWWCTFPPQAIYNVHRFMRTRLLGDEQSRWQIINSSRRQQALLQIYKGYCQSEERSCQDCEISRTLSTILAS